MTIETDDAIICEQVVGESLRDEKQSWLIRIPVTIRPKNGSSVNAWLIVNQAALTVEFR